MRMATAKVAAVQAAYVLMDQQACLAKAVDLLGQAAAEGATIVVFPEVFIPGTPIWMDSRPIIVAPNGELLAGPARQQETILTAEIDIDTVHAARRMFDPVGHYNRPDIFRLSVDVRPRPPVTLDET